MSKVANQTVRRRLPEKGRAGGSTADPSGCIEKEYMSAVLKAKIQEMVDLETKGWNTKNPDLFLSMIHPDMAWPFPPTADAHDPIDWVFVMGRFDRARWRKDWQGLFDTHDLIHNRRSTVKIEISNEQDAAFAVVDIDTLWRHKVTGRSLIGRAEYVRYIQSYQRASGNSITKQAPSISRQGAPNTWLQRTLIAPLHSLTLA